MFSELKEGKDMAVFDGVWKYGGYEVVRWMTPKQYRVGIWAKDSPKSKHYPILIVRLQDKDPKRLTERAKEFIDNRKP
jgi:hypothetical protein